ncbi:MAG: hypothetical protein WAV45_11505 [Propionibacteriaceae bacterium]|nr:hypothetical protein [Micropruina sp.]
MIQRMILAWRRFAGAPWARDHRLGMGLILLGSALTVFVGVLGPSPVALDLGPRTGWLPPWYLPDSFPHPSEWLVVPALWIGITAGAIGLWICNQALRTGWRPNVRKLFATGLGLSIATACVPPLTSADVLMYAAYGRLQTLGRDPYDITPASIFREAYDPVLRWTERPWQDTPSVYGPIASFSQWLANVLGGPNMHDVVFWLQVFAVVPFIAIALVALHLAKGNPALQARAVLFTVLNPIMIWSVVAGAHNEALCTVFAIVALLYVRKRPWLAGFFIGMAGAVKVSLVFYGLAMVWAYRRRLKALIQLGLGALVPLVVAYVVVAPKAMLAAGRNTGYISAGSWSPWLYTPFELAFGSGLAHSLISFLGLAGMIVIGWMLSRVLPWSPLPGLKKGVKAVNDPLTVTVRTALLLSAAWLLTSPYTLSWYDLIVWVPLGLLATNRLDGVFLIRGLWLSLAYVTARSVEFSPTMQNISFVIQSVISSGVAWGALIFVVWWWRDAGAELPSIASAKAAFPRFTRTPARTR